MSAGIGIFLGLCGSLAINTGNNFQSYGMHKAEVEAEEKEQLNLCSSSYWVMGTVVFITGALLNFASFGFAPQSTLASLESIQFVSNILFGKLLLEKIITQKMMIGTSLTVCGTVLAVCFSSKEAAPIENVADLVNLWKNPAWISYVVILVVLAMILFFTYRALNQRSQAYEYENVMATIYAIFSALFGTLSVVFAKLLAKLLELQAQDENVFAHWYTYFTLVSWLLLMGFWLHRLNSALGLYDPVFIIPLLQSNFIFFANISGGIYFQEFNFMKPWMWAGFCSGIMIMFVGIFLLVPVRKDHFEGELVRCLSTPVFDESQRTSNKKQIANWLMTGPGRMLQPSFDVKTSKMMNERMFIALGKKKKLEKGEAEEMKQLALAIAKANKYLSSKDELIDLMKNKMNIDVADKETIKNLMEKLVKDEKDIRINQSFVELKGEVKSTEKNECPNTDEKNTLEPSVPKVKPFNQENTDMAAGTLDTIVECRNEETNNVIDIDEKNTSNLSGHELKVKHSNSSSIEVATGTFAKIIEKEDENSEELKNENQSGSIKNELRLKEENNILQEVIVILEPGNSKNGSLNADGLHDQMKLNQEYDQKIKEEQFGGHSKSNNTSFPSQPVTELEHKHISEESVIKMRNEE